MVIIAGLGLSMAGKRSDAAEESLVSPRSVCLVALPPSSPVNGAVQCSPQPLPLPFPRPGQGGGCFLQRRPAGMSSATAFFFRGLSAHAD